MKEKGGKKEKNSFWWTDKSFHYYSFQQLPRSLIIGNEESLVSRKMPSPTISWWKSRSTGYYYD